MIRLKIEFPAAIMTLIALQATAEPVKLAIFNFELVDRSIQGEIEGQSERDLIPAVLAADSIVTQTLPTAGGHQTPLIAIQRHHSLPRWRHRKTMDNPISGRYSVA